MQKVVKGNCFFCLIIYLLGLCLFCTQSMLDVLFSLCFFSCKRHWSVECLSTMQCSVKLVKCLLFSQDSSSCLVDHGRICQQQAGHLECYRGDQEGFRRCKISLLPNHLHLWSISVVGSLSLSNDQQMVVTRLMLCKNWKLNLSFNFVFLSFLDLFSSVCRSV